MVKRGDALKVVNTAVAGAAAAVATIFALFFVSPLPVHMNYKLLLWPAMGIVLAMLVAAYFFVLLSCRSCRNLCN